MESIVSYIALFLLFLILVLMLLQRKGPSADMDSIKEALIRFDAAQEKTAKIMQDELQRQRNEAQTLARGDREELAKTLQQFSQASSTQFQTLVNQMKVSATDQINQQKEQSQAAIQSLKEVREAIEKQLNAIRDDNEKQLNQMRHTVDQKLHETLEKRLGESFKLVSERLELVHKGLGEMQSIATGVGDLKRVLDNVKTRGILGEYMLENILEQLLTPDQYDRNVAPKKGSQANVEFAVKLPGKEHGEWVWLPIDSKFPLQSYEKLLVAYETGDPTRIDQGIKELLKAVEGFARDISDKYIDPPNTTDFALMFLPIESLYGEILRHPGLFENLQRTYRVTVVGPTTLSALLNSLQMGFRTLAVQRRSSEVWKILEAVKTEFAKFQLQLEKVDKQLSSASRSLQDLRATRTSVMTRKLREVSLLDPVEARSLLEMPEEDEESTEEADFDEND
ncbi:MAG: DNA recombination protein RmuC [Bacteroidia bacterium]|jgi:DNA recombination protein RmuC